MFAPESSDVALPMMFLMWFCWGVWPPLRKKGGSDNEHFGLTAVISQNLLCLFFSFTLGMANSDGVPNFDSTQFPQMVAQDTSERLSAVLLAVSSGVVICCAEFVLAKAIDVLGVAIAVPTGFGISMLWGTAASYAIEPTADARLLFSGLGACLLGLFCDAASKLDTHKGAPEQGRTSDVEACASKVHLASGSQMDRRRFLLPVVGGLMFGCNPPMQTAAATIGQLSPYVQMVAFMLGKLLTIFPLACAYVWFSGGCSSAVKLPCAVWSGYLEACRKRPKALLFDALCGACVGTGHCMFFVGTPVVSKAVGSIFGTSSLLLSVLIGVVLFKELAGKSLTQKVLCALSVSFLSTALALMSAASLRE
ncbi:UPS4 [Symbiodinium microadriaticum]|nr:UPS4 [Symbiodinium microadriaticum]CAE7907997.1 UPS4 [Symbiodinium sp. KB8]